MVARVLSVHAGIIASARRLTETNARASSPRALAITRTCTSGRSTTNTAATTPATPTHPPPAPLGSRQTRHQNHRLRIATPSLQIACASGHFERWFEYLELGTTAHAALECAQGVALAQQGRWRYLAGWGDHQLLESILKSLLLEADIPSFDLPRQLRCRQRDNWRFWFNYGTSSVKLPHTPKHLLHGANPLPPATWAIEQLN